jgi:hypothetical protein
VIVLARSPAPQLQASSSQTGGAASGERGGSGLRYSFDITNGSVTNEISVDVKTGQVLENSVECGRR